MTKLTELSERELTELLNLPLDKARRWLQVASLISDEDARQCLAKWFPDDESSILLQRRSVRELMGLSVEEIQRLKKAGKFYKRFPYFKRRMPEDPQTRLKYLSELLSDEVEFAARYPAAYEVLFGGSGMVGGLPLPSFGLRVLQNDPQTIVQLPGWTEAWRKARESGDAFSRTFERSSEGDDEVVRSFDPPRTGYIRGILLAILGREEYAERVATELHDEAVREEMGAPAQSSVRFTDLRLAVSPQLEDSDAVSKRLKTLFKGLEQPISSRSVLQWKWDLLWEDGEKRGRDPNASDPIVTVSFAAAAILLLLDLDTPQVQSASPYRLAEQVGKLAEIVRQLSGTLDENAGALEKLSTNRSAGRPPRAERELYDALVAYRLGRDPKHIIEKLGVTPYKSSPSKSGGTDWGGTKHWKRRLEELLRDGAKVEEERFPGAAAVFTNQMKPRIRNKARLVLHAVREAYRQDPDTTPWWDAGQSIHIRASGRGLEVIQAYAQLGLCLEEERNPFPTHSDF